MQRLLVALLVVSAPLAAQTFPTSTALPAALPDGVGACGYGTPLTCTVPVTGVSGATSVSLNFTFAPAHTWYGDVRCVVTSPSGSSVLVAVNAVALKRLKLPRRESTSAEVA